MASKLDIYNFAISAVGGRALLANLNDRKPEADQCNLWYNTSRDHALQMAYWPSVRQTAVLTQLASNDYVDDWVAGDPPPPWKYSYTLPSNYLAARYIYSAAELGPNGTPGTQHQFTVEFDTNEGDRVLGTNVEDPILTYTANDVSEDLWDANLVQTVAYVLASNIVLALSGSPQWGNALMQKAEIVARNAMARQANGDHLAMTEPLSEIVQSRTGSLPGATDGMNVLSLRAFTGGGGA